MNPDQTQAILEEICKTIGGEWLLVGGGLVQLEYDISRKIDDLELVYIRHPSMPVLEAEDAVSRFAILMGLFAENLNFKARFEIEAIDGWEKESVEWHHGPAGSVFRPSMPLFVALKIRSGTEEDLRDIRRAVLKEGRGGFIEARFRRLADARTEARFDEVRERLGL